MTLNLYFRWGLGPPFKTFADRHNINAVVLNAAPQDKLIPQLAADPAWKMLHVEGGNVLYIRSQGKNRTLASEHEVRPGNFNLDRFVEGQLHKDPSFRRSILNVSNTFKQAGELDLAIAVIEAGFVYQKASIRALRELLILYSMRGALLEKKGDQRFIDDHKNIKSVLEKILALAPDDVDAKKRLTHTNKMLQSLSKQDSP